MIITMQNTETNEISDKIDELHEQRGEAALGRVLTLIIMTNEQHLEQVLLWANEASREHPCRVIAIAPSERPASADETTRTYLDAEVRFGADAGAGEVIVLRPRGGLTHHLDTLTIPLLVPDAPIVAWWPDEAPSDPSAHLVGAMANSRITDAIMSENPMQTLRDLQRNWAPQNVDMSWTRLTVWRAMLASLLDQPPHLPITSVKVTGPKDFLPLLMLAQWLHLRLQVPVTIETEDDATAVTGVYMTRADGVLSLERRPADKGIATVSVPGQQAQHTPVPTRSMQECLSEELGRLYPDEIYGEVLKSMPLD
ncbi:oxidoreductase [Bifidobacterium dolichotidis]|uniref:Oxidoreductase n=1 Tax=Bifidobacterium dolichotidis TaxID=2306976 RepID=A0A430FSN4_9BIFI|nr:glucose-6-phosphate dehydrogenase assembly protein OpcA [Bifidobacterium dolichotidis]RSX55837.1 oxidoreductase [Bifidobacterium dolichotidis]